MEIKERIIKTSLELFIKNGIRSVTMDDIANHLGISKRTIYENFKDKDELIKACLCYHKENKKNLTVQIIENAKNVIEVFFNLMFEHIKIMNTINPVFFEDLKKYHFKIWEENLCQSQHEFIENIESFLKKGIEEGFFRKDINVPITTRLLHVQLKAISDFEVFSIDRFSRIDIFIQIMLNFIRGISTRKGTKIIEKIVKENQIIKTN